MANNGIIYRDLDIELTKSNSNDFSEEFNSEAIKQSLYNILNTYKGERVMRPDFGANLRIFLFEPLDEFTADAIAETIITALGNEEPRIILETVEVIVNYNDQQYDINIRYSLRNTGIVDTLSLVLQK